MSWYTVFYLMSVADGISTFSVWIAVLATLTFIITTLIKMPAEINGGDKWIDSEQEKKNLNTIWKTATTCMIVFWFLFIAIPERKDMILIAAGGAVGEFVTNDENAKQIPHDLMILIRKELAEEIVNIDGAVGDKLKEEFKIKDKKAMLEDFSGMSEEDLRKLQEVYETVKK